LLCGGEVKILNDVFHGIDLLQYAKQFDEKAMRIEFIKKSHNYAYKVVCHDDDFILRITSDHHRNSDQIASELDFQKYLHTNGAAVVSPLLTQDNKNILCFTHDNQKYFVAAFSMAHGQNWDNRGADWTPERLINIGRELGRIHRLSRDYRPEHTEKRRKWNESQHIIKAYKIFRDYNADLYNCFIEYMDDMSKLSTGSDVFGLTHGDYLVANYMIDENDDITIFDFDECEYAWYATDIAIWMHCALIAADPEALASRTEDAEMMLYNLVKGYISENKLCKDMIHNLQKLFLMRDYIYLSTIIEDRDRYRYSEWGNQFISTCLNRIFKKKPFLEFDMSKTLDLL